MRTMMGQKFDLSYLNPFACVPGYRPEPVASSSPRELALLASFPQLSEHQEKADCLYLIVYIWLYSAVIFSL